MAGIQRERLPILPERAQQGRPGVPTTAAAASAQGMARAVAVFAGNRVPVADSAGISILCPARWERLPILPDIENTVFGWKGTRGSDARRAAGESVARGRGWRYGQERSRTVRSLWERASCDTALSDSWWEEAVIWELAGGGDNLIARAEGFSKMAGAAEYLALFVFAQLI